MPPLVLTWTIVADLLFTQPCENAKGVSNFDLITWTVTSMIFIFILCLHIVLIAIKFI